MYKVTVLYGWPDDPAAFDAYYRDVHLPIARLMRGLSGWTLSWVGKQDGDVMPPVYLVVELYAPDIETMTTVLDSPAGRAARNDVPNFATGGATMLFGVEEQVSVA
ncbi:EthD family reductase [Jiangella asiatica]|uniref:EthD family reductase n=1 Tax=Jiangella asiatica TaxID=2530372 RepID=A0A4R5DBU0_9ACTN|nr:EthD family reductase [Jiangella asiatica]TDE08005.1 EthD family reductase [Jiangella asiatica]